MGRFETGTLASNKNPTALADLHGKRIDRVQRLTDALLDRLTHHVHILEMNGESFLLKHSRK